MPSIPIDPGRRTKALGDLYGLFFEDLNHAADGGLYAEMVRNRAFEFCTLDKEDYHALTAWRALGGAALEVRAQAVTVDVALRGLEDVQMTADIKELRDTALEAVNELGEPEQVTPNRRALRTQGCFAYTFAPHSVTVMTLRRV